MRFIFAFDAVRPVRDKAEKIAEWEWEALDRPPKYVRKTEPRRRPANVKARIVTDREFENIRLDAEELVEFRYRPSHCDRWYRIVVIRKNLTVARGQKEIFDKW